MAYCEPLDRDLLFALHRELSWAGRCRVWLHLLRCPGCQRRSAQMRAASDLLHGALRQRTPILSVAPVIQARSRRRLLLVTALLLLAALSTAWLLSLGEKIERAPPAGAPDPLADPAHCGQPPEMLTPLAG